MVSNLALNGSLINFYLHKIVSLPTISEGISKDYVPLIKALFASTADTFVFQPSYSMFGHSNDTNFLYFIFDLHFRVLFFGILIFLFIKFCGWLEEYLQNLPYKERLNIFHRKLLWAFGYDFSSSLTDAKYERKKIAITIFGIDILKWFRDAVYHPWSHLTKTNRKREILMVDLLTTEGSLYSGAFTTWVPSEESVSDITMEYAIRFYPKISNLPSAPTANTRKKALIKNNGELIFSREKIETIHFWEIRKNSDVTVAIQEEQDIESAKWFILLAYVYPNYIKKITIQVKKLSDQEWNDFKLKISEWTKESKIKFEKQDNIEIKIVREINH